MNKKYTPEEILLLALKKAIKNGYKRSFLEEQVLIGFHKEYGKNNSITLWRNGWVMSHDFAKAFFGTKLLCYDCGEPVFPPETVLGGRVIIGTGNCSCSRQFENNLEAWEYHLQKMVIEEDVISYLEQFL